LDAGPSLSNPTVIFIFMKSVKGAIPYPNLALATAKLASY
jgi:hypothetical protein